MRKAAILFILFFIYGIKISISWSASPIFSAKSSKDASVKARLPASLPEPTPEGDEGAEEDEEKVRSDVCRPPMRCQPKVFSGGFEEPAESRNPISRAFVGYSNSAAINDLIRLAREQIELNPKKYIIRKINGKVQTYCYAAVKDALKAAGMLPNDYSCSRFARNGVMDLQDPSVGFKNLLDLPVKGEVHYETKLAINSMLVNNPSMAPKGAVLVYSTIDGAVKSNGKPVDPAGHVEIKIGEVGKDLYISVSEKEVPTYGYSVLTQRTLIGVMYLPRLLSPDSIYYRGQIPF